MVVDDVEDFCAAVIGEMPVCDVGLPASERVLFFGGGISRGPSCRTTSAEHRRACRSDSVGLGVGGGLTVAAAFRASRPSRAARRRGRPVTAQDLMLGPSWPDITGPQGLFGIQNEGASLAATRDTVSVSDGFVEGAQPIQADVCLPVGPDGSRSGGSDFERAVVDDLRVFVGLARQAEHNQGRGMVVGSRPDGDAAGAVGALDLDCAVVLADRIMSRCRRRHERDIEERLGRSFCQRPNEVSVEGKFPTRMQ
ncbi:hypothetical protein SHTP_2076 [Mycobacterium ulcerans subsp. shinshuense]|uniref:Uncharacterized protein n=1 Tax=Mycobacterium ulcerans subsp. shinshuense TaxID=1124626 RepID=A0A1B4Y2I5_MYCUL|nr:hypothetical protein SHTP_2076 [Mycobacterium ulcerans subsp. shinshuense]